jgi:hypothetical protein
MAIQNEYSSNLISANAEMMFVSSVFSSRVNDCSDQVHVAEAGHPVHNLLSID